MNALKKLPVLVCMAVGAFPSWGAESMAIDDKENRPPASVPPGKEDMPAQTFGQQVADIAAEVEKGYREASAWRICKAYDVFSDLQPHDGAWEALGKSLEVVKWPSQETWREAVGGHLFYPKQIMEWDVADAQAYRLERIDTIWALAISSKFRHPFGMYYLGGVLSNIYSNSTSAELPDFFHNLCNSAFDDLEAYLKTGQKSPDACYILGQGHSSFREILLGRNDHHKSMEYHAKGGDLKNQYQVLKLKGSYRRVYTPPSPEEYLVLARMGYHPAYLEAARLLEDGDKKLEVLNEAVEKGYVPALVKIGTLYKELCSKDYLRKRDTPPVEDCLQKAREYYQKAGEQGMPGAYIVLGITYVGDIVLHDDEVLFREKLYALPPATIEKAALFFQQAGEAHHPEGWDYLFRLYLNLYRQAEAETEKEGHSPEWTEKKERYADLMWESLGKGLALGSQHAYYKAHYLYRGVFQELCQQYGSAPQDRIFRKRMEKFIFPSNPD